MVDTPGLMEDTIPVPDITATTGLPELQVPPGTVLLNVLVAPSHIAVKPEIADGDTLITTGFVS